MKVTPYTAYKAHSAGLSSSSRSKWTPLARSSSFKSRWEPPKQKLSPPPTPVPTPALPPPSKVLYYGLWGGKLLPNTPPLFDSPAQAAAWAISRFHRDGLANIWGERKYPFFLYYVGVVNVDAAQMDKVRLHDFVHNAKLSSIEKQYWAQVDFYSVADSFIFSSNYMQVKAYKFDAIVATYKPTPCYQASAGSIYEPGITCPTSCHSDVEFMHCQSLSHRLYNLKKSNPGGAPFIQIEKSFGYLKQKEYCDLGELHVHTFIL